MIYEIKNFTDGKAIIVANIPTEQPEPKLGQPQLLLPTIYESVAYVGDGSGGAVKIPFQFPIGTTLNMCFEKFTEFATNAINKMIEEKKKEIIVPPSNLVDPSGNQIPSP